MFAIGYWCRRSGAAELVESFNVVGLDFPPPLDLMPFAGHGRRGQFATFKRREDNMGAREHWRRVPRLRIDAPEQRIILIQPGG